LVRRLAGVTPLLKTLEQCRVGCPRGSVQGFCLDFKCGFGLCKIRVDFLLVRQIKRNRSVNFLERIGNPNALFKPRADTGQPVMSSVCRVPRTRRKALGAWRRGDSKRPLAC